MDHKGLFTRTVTVSVSITVSVKVYHCVNESRLFDGHLGSQSILSNGLSLCTQCKFDREGDGHGYGEGEGDGTCKLALKQHLLPYYMSISGRKCSLFTTGILQKNSWQEFTEFTSLYRRLRCDCASRNRKDELHLSTVSPQQMCAGWDDQTR